MAPRKVPGREPGRPPKLDLVVDRSPDGKSITASEKVLQVTREVWAPWDVVAKSAGITRATLATWIREGGLARGKIARGEKVTANQRRYASFLDALEKAESEAINERLSLIRTASKGGYERTKVVEKVVVRDGEEKVVERTTTTETADPLWTAAAWLLERRRPADFGRRVEVSAGEPLGTKEDRIEALVDAAESYLDGVADGAKRAKEAKVDG